MLKKQFQLGKEARLTAIVDDRFKFECLSINFIFPLNGEENALSYLLPSVLVRETQKYGKLQIMNSILEEAYDSEIGTDTVKLSNYRVIRFAASWLKSKLTFDGSDPFDITLSVLSEIILRPVKENGLLSKRYTELEKQALLDFALSENNNKKSFAYHKCLDMILENDPYSHPKYGSEEEITGIDNKILTDFYDRVLSRAKIEIYYHGSSDIDHINNSLTEALGEILIYDRPKLPKTTIPSKPKKCPEAVFENGDCSQTVYAMGLSIPNEKDEKYPFIMLGELLYYSPVSRLFMNVREELGICYYCDYSGLRSRQAGIITAGIELKRLDEAKEAIWGQIDDLAKGNISDEEMESAKNVNIDNYLALFDNPKDMESLVLLSELTGDSFDADKHINGINSVSKEDVSEIAKRIKIIGEFILKENK